MDLPWYEDFYAEGMLVEIVSQLKSGKEATVFVCRSGLAMDAKFVAVKSFHGRLARGFQNRILYQDGRVITNSRTARAVATKTRFGRKAEEAAWVDREFDVLCRLHAAGADVPQPFGTACSAIVMEFIGIEERPAPQLRDVRLTRRQAGRLFEQLMGNIERLLVNNVIHADLSAYNILLRDDKATIIDFPQAVDPRTNSNAQLFLQRDVTNLCRYFERFGVCADAERLSGELWLKFLKTQV